MAHWVGGGVFEMMIRGGGRRPENIQQNVMGMMCDGYEQLMEANGGEARILLKSFEGFTSFAMSLGWAVYVFVCVSVYVWYHKLLYVHIICHVCVQINMKEHYVPKRYCRVRCSKTRTTVPRMMPNVMDVM